MKLFPEINVLNVLMNFYKYPLTKIAYNSLWYARGDKFHFLIIHSVLTKLVLYGKVLIVSNLVLNILIFWDIIQKYLIYIKIVMSPTMIVYMIEIAKFVYHKKSVKFAVSVVIVQTANNPVLI